MKSNCGYEYVENKKRGKSKGKKKSKAKSAKRSYSKQPRTKSGKFARKGKAKSHKSPGSCSDLRKELRVVLNALKKILG